MARPARHKTIALASAAVLAGMAPVAVGIVLAQVRKCYVEVCTTTADGKTYCYEKEVECPKPS